MASRNILKSAAIALVLSFIAFGSLQAAAPSIGQLRQLQNLSEEEARQLLESVLGRRATQRPEDEEIRGREKAPDEDLEEEAKDEEEEEPRFAGEDTLVIRLDLPSPDDPLRLVALTAVQLDAMEAVRAQIREANPYELDRFGMLTLPGRAPFALGGLTVEEATARLQAEPDLIDFVVTVTRLPLAPLGTRALEPFGYLLFERVPSTFAPAEFPVPAEYVIGPGDTIRVQLFGNVNEEYEFEVNRDGTVMFPDVGPVVVSGLTFAQLTERLKTAVAEQLIGTRASVTMGKLRSITVFVLGDAVSPGSYTVSGLSTVTNALFASGGVLPNGSLRNIQLKRNGEVITRLDFYDLLLRGDTSSDVRLRPGDVIFIPPKGPTVGAEGQFQRPAIYELRGERTIQDVMRLAGGLRPNADTGSAKLDRIAGQTGVTVLNIDLGSSADLGRQIRSGDVLHVFSKLDQADDIVTLHGNVHRPGRYQWTPGMRISDVIKSTDALLPMSDLHYVLIRREVPPARFITTHSVDVQRAIALPGSDDDVRLEPRDQIFVMDFGELRDRLLAPILEELEVQATRGTPAQVVRIDGRVRVPGQYPLEAGLSAEKPGMRVSDLLRAGGSLGEAAYALEAELARYTVVGGQFRETELVQIDLEAVLAGDVGADLSLQPHDFLNIKEIPQWAQQETVEIVGEVQFPGLYPIQRGESLGSVLRRAGGLTDLAFPEGVIFVREDLKRREREQLLELARRLESDLVALALSEGGSPQALTVGQSLLTQLRTTEPVGRLVIDIERIQAGEASADDIFVKDMDKLYIPKQVQEVTVLGEVQYATSHIYQSGLDRDDYIGRSGGLTERADNKRIYVVRANGGVVAGGGSKWFRRTGDEIKAGDTIVVPLETDRIRPLTLWTQVTSILFNVAIAVTAINSF